MWEKWLGHGVSGAIRGDFDVAMRASAACFVVDDEPAIGRFIAAVAGSLGVAVEQFLDLPSMIAALDERLPKLIFLDVSLGASDAIDAIRHLAAIKYAGAVQLMSGRDAMILDDVRLIGERHGLLMLPALAKPFGVDAVRRIIEDGESLEAAGAGLVAATRRGL